MNAKRFYSRKITLFLSILIFLALFSSCSSRSIVPLDSMTKEQMLEDYDFMWATLDESYPFMGLLEREGIDVDLIKESGRQMMEEAEDSYDYFSILYNSVYELNYTGHVSFLDYYNYMDTCDIYSSETNLISKAISRPWTSVLNNKETQANYELLRQILAEPEFEPYEEASGDEFDSSKSDIESNVIMDDFIVYLKIPSFYRNLENDHIYLLDFYEKYADFDHLIIDIRGNGGGYNWYWEYNIVCPNISEELDYYDLQLYRDSKQNKPFINTAKIQGAKTYDISELPDLENVSESDLSAVNKYMRFEQTSYPEFEEKLFNGRIWVLTDEDSYSAAEMFSYFCKQTGFATLVGEPTGGDGPGVSPAIFSLPNSGFVVQYSCSNGLNLDGSCNEEYGTEPDILIGAGEDALRKCMTAILDERNENYAEKPAA